MKGLIKLAVVGLFFLSASALFGHPPDSLQLNLDSTGTMLSVKVFHPVKNPANHFIVTIEVNVNGAQAVMQTYNGQFDKYVQEAVYKLINLKSLDQIEVTGVCSISGKKKAVLIVPEK